MKRYQIMKNTEPDDTMSCNTSYLPHNIMDVCSKLRNYASGDMLIMLHDMLSNEYALIKTPLANLWENLEYIIAQICGSENTPIYAVKKYTTARIIVLDVNLTKQHFEINKTYEFYDGRLREYTPNVKNSMKCADFCEQNPRHIPVVVGEKFKSGDIEYEITGYTLHETAECRVETVYFIETRKASRAMHNSECMYLQNFLKKFGQCLPSRLRLMEELRRENELTQMNVGVQCPLWDVIRSVDKQLERDKLKGEK